jgi:Na+-driven multidrug efflux pump
MSETDIAAQTILRNIGLLFFMIPVGISISTSILVGNNIGAYKLEAAKYYAKMCFLTALIWSVLSVLVVLLL